MKMRVFIIASSPKLSIFVTQRIFFLLKFEGGHAILYRKSMPIVDDFTGQRSEIEVA
jgi:hypothetical protein